jgi:hypothetical protein
VEVVADCRRLRSALDWVPRYADLVAIVRDAWRWEQRSAAGRGLRAVGLASGTDPDRASVAATVTAANELRGL